MAAVIGVRDFICKDLLQEGNLNPEWEKWKGYFFTVSVMCSLFPFYLTIGGIPLHCEPVEGSTANITLEPLSIPEAAYVNERCAVSADIIFTRVWGAIMLMTCVATHLASTFWLRIRFVKESLRTFSEACNKLTELVLSTNEMKNLCLLPMSGTNSVSSTSTVHKTIREVCVLLVLHKPQKSIFRFYLLRCAMVILVCCIHFGLYVSFHDCPFLLKCDSEYVEAKKLYHCILDKAPIKRFQGFECAVGGSRFIIYFVSAFTAMLFLQLICVIVALIRVSSPAVSNRSLRLMIAFWDSAIPTKSGMLKKILLFLFSEQYARLFLRNSEEICKNGDIELVRIGTKLLGRIPQVVEYLSKEFDNDIKTIHVCAFPKDKYKNFLESAKYSINHRVTISLAEKLIEFKQWELLVCLLENSSLKEGERADNDISNLRLESLEDLDCKESTSILSPRHSILYYAFLSENDFGPVRFAAARFLCYGRQLCDLYVVSEVGKEINRMPLTDYLLTTYGLKVCTGTGLKQRAIFTVIADCLLEWKSRSGLHSYRKVDLHDETVKLYRRSASERDVEMGCGRDLDCRMQRMHV